MSTSTPTPAEALVEAAQDWWQTSIIDIEPGKIHVRGYPIEELIGTLSYPQMVWLMLRGEIPSAEQAALLQAALVAAVDHGPHAPSIAISRMAVTCGLPLNGAMASAINALDDVHGGAGQQCMELLNELDGGVGEAGIDGPSIEAGLDRWIAARGAIVPGYGHRFHGTDPRSVRLLALVDEAAGRGIVGGRFAALGRALEAALSTRKGRRIPMNIDAATAVIYCELGFAPPLGRGLFILSRSVGILAHAWEQTGQGARIKGPMTPRIPYRYTGVPTRHLPKAKP
jgi:citrate synthase